MSDALPEGWSLVPLRDFTKIEWGNTGITKKSYVHEGFPAFSASGQDGYLIGHEWEGPAVILSAIGARCGKCFLADEKWTAIKNTIVIQGNPTFIDHKLLFYYLNDEKKWVISGTGQPFITMGTAKEILFPFAPLAEQKRIVAKLEKLLEKVDASRARLDKIPRLLKRFRQSVLAAACSGKLTADWREENGGRQWEDCCFGDLVESTANGLSKRKGDVGDWVTVLRLADFKDAVRVYGNERQIRLNETEDKKYSLKRGDILVIRVNGSADLAGRFICYIEDNKHETYCDHFIRFRIHKHKANPEFITYLANEGEGRWYLRSKLSTSAGQNTINQKSINDLSVSLPPLAEQQEIVKRVEELFDLADRLEARYTKAKAQVERLTQSILAKAFRGELVPQDPTDEPAEKLLARIRGKAE